LGVQLGLSSAPAVVVAPLQMQPLVPMQQEQQQHHQQQQDRGVTQPLAASLQAPQGTDAIGLGQGDEGQFQEEQEHLAASNRQVSDTQPPSLEAESTGRDSGWHSVAVPNRLASVPVGGTARVQGGPPGVAATPLSSQPVGRGNSSSSHGLSVNGLRKAAMGAARSTFKGVKGAVRAATSTSTSAGGAVPHSCREGLHHIDRRASVTWGGEKEEQKEGRLTPAAQQLGDDDSWAEVPGSGRHKSKTE
jgi:hypothetical protein